MSEALLAQLALLPDYLSRHLLLAIVALAGGSVVTALLTLAVLRVARLRRPVLAVASIVQTVPALALLALMVPALARIGFLPAAIALTLYSVLPMLRNAVDGIDNVDRDLVEAGHALGMTRQQVLLRIELPLALPMIVAGIRTAAVWVVGMATLSTAVGATSLGNYIFTGLQTQNYTAVVVGCVAAAGLALALDRLIGLVEAAIAMRSRTRTLAALAATLVLAAAGLWPSLASIVGATRAPVLIGTKTFTEQYILADVIGAVLERAGFESRSLQSLGSTVAFDALASGRIDCYVDYTGTIWANHMKRTDNPGRDAMFREVREWLAREHDIEIAARLGFENAYALALPRRRAEELGLRTVADLRALAPTLKVGGDYEIFERPEWRDLTTVYGLTFRERVAMDSSLMYSAVTAGTVDLITAFSSDGRIPAADLVLLEDSRAALPAYDAVVLVSADAARRHRGMRQVLAALEGAIDGRMMRAANRSVDVEGVPVEASAAELVRAIETGPSRAD